MTTLTEALHPGAFIVAEAGHTQTRDTAVIALSQTIVVGQVLGRRIAGTVTSSVAADAGNTGNGVFTIDGTTPVAAGARDGVYRVINDLVAANGGEFQVFDPEGVEIGRVAVGATFNNQIKFSIADGATDFTIGDAFSVTVGIEDSDYEYAALNYSATDGLANAAGIAVYPVTTDGSNKQSIAVMVRGPSQVRLSDLTFPSGSAAQQAEVLRQLDRLGIVAR